MPEQYEALVLVGAYGGPRWGEAVGLTRANVDVLRSRLIVESTAIEVHGKVTLGQEPKTRRSKRTVPLARSVMRRSRGTCRITSLRRRTPCCPPLAAVARCSGRPSPGRPGDQLLSSRASTASPSTVCGTASSPSWSQPAQVSLHGSEKPILTSDHRDELDMRAFVTSTTLTIWC